MDRHPAGLQAVRQRPAAGAAQLDGVERNQAQAAVGGGAQQEWLLLTLLLVELLWLLGGSTQHEAAAGQPAAIQQQRGSRLHLRQAQPLAPHPASCAASSLRGAAQQAHSVAEHCSHGGGRRGRRRAWGRLGRRQRQQHRGHVAQRQGQKLLVLAPLTTQAAAQLQDGASAQANHKGGRRCCRSLCKLGSVAAAAAAT